MDLTVMAVIAVICAIASAAIMSGKTDSQGKVVLYLLLGLFIGIFGVILAAVAPNEKASPASSPSQPTRSCPMCREVILADALKCKHCGERIDKLYERVH